MTLEEKASLCSGANSWDTEKIDRVGLPKITMSDGPHGLRRQEGYEDKGMEATASASMEKNIVVTKTAIGWPTASALAASFDKALLGQVGGLLGDECLAYDTQILLGPGVNIKRSPLCGRNFEYFSEDPCVAGASLATAICKLVSFAILITPYLKRKSLLHLSIRNFHMSMDIMKEIIGVGSSSMFRSGLAVVSAIMLNKIAGQISDSVLAGIGVCNKIMMFPFGIILGFGNGFQPVAGFNWGAKQYDRVSESYRFSSWVATLGSVVMGAALYVLAPGIIRLFAGQDPHMLQIATLCLRLQCLALPIHAWVVVVNMLCVSLGEAKGALLLSTARQGTCFIPIVIPMGKLWGADGLAGVQSVADVLSLVLAIPLAVQVHKKVKTAEKQTSPEPASLPRS